MRAPKDEQRCESLDPVGMIGRNVRCDLDAGHEGKHKATRTQDGWTSTALWAQDPVDDELRALRKVAHAAAAYLELSKLSDSKHWATQLELHNNIAHWRNIKAASK